LQGCKGFFIVAAQRRYGTVHGTPFHIQFSKFDRPSIEAAVVRFPDQSAIAGARPSIDANMSLSKADASDTMTLHWPGKIDGSAFHPIIAMKAELVIMSRSNATPVEEFQAPVIVETADQAPIMVDRAYHALGEAVSFQETRQVRNLAVAAAAYAREAHDTRLVSRATELRTRAERKAGQMLAESATRGQRATKHGNVNRRSKVSGDTTPTLSQIGVTRDQSSTWQHVAASRSSMPLLKDKIAVITGAAWTCSSTRTTRHAVNTSGKGKADKDFLAFDSERFFDIVRLKGHRLGAVAAAFRKYLEVSVGSHE
jgi:hypothetical protein